MRTINISTVNKFLKKLVPELFSCSARYKGQNGKVGIFGGSIEYTGAPYYASASSLRSGADLTHIFTPHESALIPLKCYSPETIVHFAKTSKDLI